MRMLPRRGVVIGAAIGLIALLAPQARALYIVSRYGKTPFTRETAEQYGWPKSVLDLTNSPLREQAWHPIFSECSNDHTQFGYRLKDAEDANRLLQTAAGLETGRPAVLLSPAREFHFNREQDAYEATFGLGSQKIIDAWWKHLPGGRFGVDVYLTPPPAAPPLLTLYLGGTIQPEKLRLPTALKVTAAPVEAGKAKPEEAAARKEIERLLAAREKG